MRKRSADENRANTRGIALITAIIGALIISLLAAAVINMTFRQFEFSVFRSGSRAAGAISEGGLQYVFARLEADRLSDGNYDGEDETGFDDLIRFDNDPPYVISTEAVGSQVTIRYNGVDTNFDVDEQVPELNFGTVDQPVSVSVAIEENPNNSTQLMIHSSLEYGV